MMEALSVTQQMMAWGIHRKRGLAPKRIFESEGKAGHYLKEWTSTARGETLINRVEKNETSYSEQKDRNERRVK